jgi:hypothetical protein
MPGTVLTWSSVSSRVQNSSDDTPERAMFTKK